MKLATVLIEVWAPSLASYDWRESSYISTEAAGCFSVDIHRFKSGFPFLLSRLLLLLLLRQQVVAVA
jgi:hypothetical protein